MIQNNKVVEFFRQFTPLKYKKGEIILRPFDERIGLCYLETGYVRQYATTLVGQTLILHVFRPGSYFPMTWAVNETNNLYYFEAVTGVTLWRAPRVEAAAFFQENPDILYEFTSRLLLGVSGMLARFESIVTDSAYRKTAGLVHYFATTFGEKGAKGEVVLSVALPHREIAAWIGTSRETASLSIEKLLAGGVVRYRGRRLIVPSLARLEAELRDES